MISPSSEGASSEGSSASRVGLGPPSESLSFVTPRGSSPRTKACCGLIDLQVFGSATVGPRAEICETQRSPRVTKKPQSNFLTHRGVPWSNKFGMGSGHSEMLREPFVVLGALRVSNEPAPVPWVGEPKVGPSRRLRPLCLSVDVLKRPQGLLARPLVAQASRLRWCDEMLRSVNHAMFFAMNLAFLAIIAVKLRYFSAS